MDFRYYITVLILIISEFLIFSLIGVLNRYSWMNLTYNIMVALLGCFLIIIGIIDMIMFLIQKEKITTTKKDDFSLDNL